MLFKEALTFALFTSLCSTENKVVSVFKNWSFNVHRTYIFIHTDIEGSYIDVAYLDSGMKFRDALTFTFYPSVHLSVHPSFLPLSSILRYLLLNHWRKSNQIWCVSCSHEWDVHQHIFFLPRLLWPCGGAKRSNIIKFQLQSQFHIFLNQSLCVFSQMKDIKHIRQDFHSSPRSGPRGGTWGGTGGLGGQIFFFLNSTKFGVWVTHMNGTCNGTIFWVCAPWGPIGRCQKVKYC